MTVTITEKKHRAGWEWQEATLRIAFCLEEKVLPRDEDDLEDPIWRRYAEVRVFLPEYTKYTFANMRVFVYMDKKAPTWKIETMWDATTGLTRQYVPGNRDTWAPDDFNTGDDGYWEKFYYNTEKILLREEYPSEALATIKTAMGQWLEERAAEQAEAFKQGEEAEKAYRLAVLVPKEEARQKRIAERKIARKAFEEAEKAAKEKEDAETLASANPFAALKGVIDD